MSDPSRLFRPDPIENASHPDANVSHLRREPLEIRHEDASGLPIVSSSPGAPGDKDDIAVGDSAAFERLFTAYADRLCRYMNRYVKSWAESEELVQDVFLRLWQRRAYLPTVRDVEGYLYTLARYRALNYLRRRRAAERGVERAAERAEPDAGLVIFDDEMPGEIQAAIQRAVDTLPARQREVLLLRWRDGASYREIMAQLGIAEQTVGTHLRRAINQLREILPRFL